MFAQTAEAPATGDGSTGNPYQISTWQNLYWISQNSSKWDKHYIQTADITFPQTINEWENYQGWKPIGNDVTNFTGTYDGKSKIINGLFINRPNKEHVGLFAVTNNAAIKDIGLLNVSISGYMFTGGLVGSNNSTTITQSYCEGNITGEDFVGGLVGANLTSLIENCYSTANVSWDSNFGTGVGGLVGHNGSSTIINSYSTGSVTGEIMVGGLVGINSNSATINNCYSENNVTGKYYIGGLVGDNGHSSSINNCYSKSNVTGKSTSGGLVGHNFISLINNCYCRGTVTCNSMSSEVFDVRVKWTV